MSRRPVNRRNVRRPKGIVKLFRELTGEPLLLEQECCWLILLSVFDLLMTYVLLRQGMQFYEANPVARWWFTRWNIAGMTAFKFLMVGVAVASCEVIERRRPFWGRAVLWLGIVAAAVVFLRGGRCLSRGSRPWGRSGD